MKKTKKILSVLLAVVMLLSMLPLSISGAATIANGTTGNCQWSLDDSGVFTVSGNGAMGFYSQWQYTPYLNRYRGKIITAKIEEGVIEVGSNAFCCCEKLNSVEICNTVTAIQFYAFNNCFSLSTVKLPENLTYIGNHAFYQCYALETVYMGRNVKTIESYAFGRCNNLKDVYYSGNEEEWNSITINGGNDYLKNANIHFNFGTTKEETEFINEHISFVNSSAYSSAVEQSFYKNVWISEEDKELKNIVAGSVWEYLGDVDELISFKIDDLTITANPYELIFFDLINNYNVVDTYCDIGLTKAFSVFNNIYDSLMNLFKSTDEWNKDISDSVKNALTIDVKKFLSTDNYQFSSSDAYETFCKFLTNSKNNKAIDEIFTGLNLASDVSDYISTAGDVAQTFRNIVNAYSTAVAFKESNEVLKKILVYCDYQMFIEYDIFGGSFSDLILDYFSIQSDADAFNYALSQNIDSIVSQSFNILAKGFLKNSSLTMLSNKFNIKGATASKLLMTYSYTYKFLEYVTKTGEKSKVYSLLAAAAHFEKYLSEYNNFAANRLLSSSSLDNAIDFDVSWRMLQILNSFAYENLAEYDRLSEKSVFGKYVKRDNGEIVKSILIASILPGHYISVFDFVEKDDDYYNNAITFAVNKALNWKNTSCHLKNYDMRKLMSVKCPTEVFVYKNGELVLSISEEEIICNDNNITFSIIGEQKYISVPCDDEYEIKITATDDGNMTYDVHEMYEGDTVRFVSYENIPLEKGKSYTGGIPTDFYVSFDMYNLVSENGSIETADINIYNEEDLQKEAVEEKEATETEDGYIKTVTDDAEYIIVLHNWTEETVITPTCTNVGKTVVKCTACGETKYYNIVEAAEHNYNENIIAANCTANGYTSHTCTGCGDSYTDNYVDATGHTDNNNDNTCDNCGEKIKQDVDTNCNHICHSNNKFLKFIWNIFNFLMRLFSMEKICSCGAAHY